MRRDSRIRYGPEGLTNDQERDIIGAKKQMIKKALEVQILENAFSKHETNK